MRNLDEVLNIFCEVAGQAISGGSATDDFDSLLNKCVDEGALTADEVNGNELDLAIKFDENWFTCSGCGWTLPICGLDYESKGVDLTCEDCAQEF